MRDTDFVARLHRNFALLGGQLKTQLKNHVVPLRTLKAAQPLSLRRRRIKKKRLLREPLKQHRSTRQPLAWTGTMTSTCLQTTSPIPIRPILLFTCCMACMAIIAIY